MKKKATEIDIKQDDQLKTCNLLISENGKDYLISFYEKIYGADLPNGPLVHVEKLDIPGGIPYEVLNEYGLTERFDKFVDLKGE